MTEGELGWAAGIIDGEGCIQIARRVRGRSVQWPLWLTVVNTDIRALRKMQQLFGGSIQVLIKPNTPNRKPSWTWVASYGLADTCLRAVLPWLVIKREQAEIAILSREQRDRSRRKRTPQEHEYALWCRLRLQELKITPMTSADVPGRAPSRAEGRTEIALPQ